MASAFPATPGRGRSRFSKALPMAPREPSPKSFSRYQHSPLPALPKDAMAAPMMIPRRPVGGSVKEKAELSQSSSIAASLSSVYSKSPGLSDGSDSSSDHENDSLSGVDSETGPPPLPEKDAQRQHARTPPQAHILAQLSAGYKSSPSPTEIWRRRSVKSEGGIRFPDLKLERSNGSTASPPQRQERPERSLPAIPFQLPRSTNNRKPVPTRPAPPQPELMGNKITKLKEKEKEKHSRAKLNAFANEEPVNRENGTATQNHDPSDSDLAHRPTQERVKQENKSPIITTTALDPSSPAPDLPRRSDARLPTRGETVTLLPTVSITTTSEDPIDYLSSTSHSRDASETLTITSDTIMRSPQPQKPHAATRILTPQPSPSPTMSPTSPLAVPSLSKISFPTYPAPVALPGAVVPGPPLSTIQLNCFQSHRFMRSTRNTLCPVACMVCQRRDADQRWRCSWCCLSACGSCMQVLAAIPGKDLNVCLDKIRKSGLPLEM
ncbi:hypothetical protein BJ875DRAFT_485983 [Amylocarpus encephaloides]|uniref:Uncharacterized protein n=1 Tax=Amylocarpus encephaloides TaxID=45428 RepID=A0A9P8C3V8_9HELO|nr:hypothetical protein BJ875DRAFT_485983 [Amylocarpus encephaloides]